MLWNAHAPALWARFTTHLRREIAKAAGITQRDLHHHATLSYAKVAEYQKRGQVHFHAVIRLDGPTGPASTPPAWATTQFLDHAIRAAAARTRVTHEGQPAPSAEQAPGVRESGQGGRSVFQFGRQIDVRAIRGTDFTGDGPVTDRHVAAYIAKYATKGAETTTGTLDRRLRLLAELAQYDITDHARRMIHTAWHLASRPQYARLRLRQWAHMLGFRGHFSTRTRHYSTTLTHLRTERTTWRSNRADHSTDLAAGHAASRRQVTGQHDSPDTTLVISHWQYAGTGLLPELAHLSELLTARQPTRPESLDQLRQSECPGDRVDHSTGQLTGAVQAGAIA